MLYTGTLNVYFPCELKNLQGIKRARKMWKDIAKCHKRGTRRLRFPNTNQMDILGFRQQKEDILKAYQAFWATRLGVRLPNGAAGCYATHEIADEYRHPREDNLFVKNVSLPLSSFKVEYPPITDGNKGIKIDGKFIFSVNIDNNVYAYFRYVKDDNGNIDGSKVVMVIINFSKEGLELKMSRFAEFLSVCESWNDVIENKMGLLNAKTSMEINANGIIILETKKTV